MTTKNHRPTSEHGQADQCPSCGSYCDIFQDLDEQDYCNDCRAETPESRRAETLEKFNNGEQRYEDDQNFKEAVDSLAAKIGVYAVLDKTLNQLRVLREIHTRSVQEIGRQTLINRAQNEKYQELSDLMANRTRELNFLVDENARIHGLSPNEINFPLTMENDLRQLNRELREQNKRLADEVAGYKDALDLVSETRKTTRL